MVYNDVVLRPDTSTRPVIIISERARRTRTGENLLLSETFEGDFIREAVNDLKNIYLTSLVREYIPIQKYPSKLIGDGVLHIIDLIENAQPKYIICLGETVLRYVRSIILPSQNPPVIKTFPEIIPFYMGKDPDRFAYKELLHKLAE